MATWRPEGWKNPYMGKVGGDLGNVYQAGADAMLEAIISRQLQKGHIDVIGYGKLKTKMTPQDVIALLGMFD